MNEKVLYFSLDPKRKKSFYSYIKDANICYRPKFSFDLVGEEEQFFDPRDLLSFIEKEDKKDSLHVIIDYVSCCGTGKEINYSTVLRNIIMCFPEVQFLFDETFVKKEKKNSQSKENKSELGFLNFLFWNSGTKELLEDEKAKGKPDVFNIVLAEFHQFDLGDFSDDVIIEQFILLLKGRNNQFDASSLRYAIKKQRFYELSIKDNYSKLDDSRYRHAAVVVEEEYHQSQFNSYCLYANGYRVFPIVCATELLRINKDEYKQYIDNKNSRLLLRDYDLQFLDENLVSSGVKIVKCDDENDCRNEIDYIRGAKIQKSNHKIREYISLDENNPYWKSFEDKNIFYVSKGDENQNVLIDIDSPQSKDVSDKPHLKLRGIMKPLEGIYAWVHQIGLANTIYEESRDSDEFETRRTNSEGHSCPLDIYGIVRPMILRAENYYLRDHRYRLAALVAGEALGILNGFHKSLMNKAYYIQAISENAMAMSLLGGDENMLREDIRLRLKVKVKKDVGRMIPNPKGQKNLLYNIFNDCVLFCQEKEYFNAADEALSIMVNEKDGIDIIKLLKKLFKKKQKTK